MKRLFAILLSVMMLVSVSVIAVSAATAEVTEVYVTICDKDGGVAVTAEKVNVTDSDNDGAITISDALYAAHDAFYPDGAAAGYETETSQYGLGLKKLWGVANGGSYGYYVNNASAWALTDPVQNGDYVVAFIYTDLVGWSDHYSYFDRFMGDVKADEELTLTYSEVGFDPISWDPQVMPVEGAVITVDGQATEYKTDAEGKVTLKLSENGTHIISAKADGKTLVSPIFVAEVTGAPEPTEEPLETPDELLTGSPEEEPTEPASPDEEAPTDDSDDQNPYSVGTGMDTTIIFAALGIMLLASAVIVLRKRYEK